ncbi:hypothetical protein NMY22_g15234 [Coprinellus aureogranulatus]|nr:hypothetical protein NMY22_g15234 [Coprinellus aureogranulatus]
MPLNVPRKRTFAATSAYESDAENNDTGSNRSRRRRTSSDSTVDTVRVVSLAKALAPGQPKRDVLRTTSGGNLIGSLTTAPKHSVSISKPEPPQPSGIPRSVALKAKRVTSNAGTVVTQPKATSKPSLSTTTRPSPAAPVVVKALKLKENQGVPDHGGSVSAIDMESSSSKLERKKSTTTLQLRSASASKKTLESLLSGEKKAIQPSRTSSTRKEPQLERRSPPTQRKSLSKDVDEPAKEVPRVESRPLITDAHGCVHLAPADCDLLISFVDSPYYEVWDIGDEASIACPAYLYIMAKDVSRWAGTALAQPDITLINIECRTKRGPSRFSDRHSDLDHWKCHFDGIELPSSSGPITSANVPQGSISIEMKWDRVYWMPPTFDTHSRRSNSGDERAPRPTHTRKANSLSSLLSAGPQGQGMMTDDPRAGAPGRGWCMKFWIPIPARLFLRKETRMFEVDARVHIVPGVDRRTVEVGRDYGFIAAHSEMTVSHLRSEREMDILL